jgi:hypothetical protein
MKRLIILVVVLFTAIGTFVVNLGPREMTLKDLHPVYTAKPSTEIPVNDTDKPDSPIKTEERNSGSEVKLLAESTSNSASASTSTSTTYHISLLPNLSKKQGSSVSKAGSDSTSVDKPRPEPKAKSEAKAVAVSEAEAKPKPKTGSIPVTDSEAAWYIIVESLKDKKAAEQRADKLKEQFSMDFFALPPTKEGNYRVSCGKYTSLEAARSAVKNVRTSIQQDVWIFSSIPAAQH